MREFGSRYCVRIFCLVVIALFARQARAAEITYDSTTGTLPQFDGALGTLTGAEYSVIGTLDFSVTNAYSAPIGVGYSFSVGLTINGPALSYKDPGYDPDQTGTYNWGANALIDPGATVSHEMTVDISRVADLNLTPLIGAATILLDLGRSEDSDVCSSYDLAPDQERDLSCSSTRTLTDQITYTYAPAMPGDPAPLPEPSAALLLGFSLAALLLRRV